MRRLTRLYLGTVAGVLTLRRRDADWRPLHMGLLAHSIAALAVPPDHPETVFAAAGDTLFQTTDGGAHWRRVGAPLPEAPISALLALSNPRTGLLAGLTPTAIARSLDAGATWRPVALPPLAAGTIGQFMPAPGEPTLIYAVVGEALLVSLDAGATWQPVVSLRAPVTSLVVHPDSPGTLYVGGPAGLFRTRNGARTWQRLNPQPLSALIVHPARPRTLIAALPGGLVHTSNAGASWQVMPGGEAEPSDPIRALFGHAAGEVVLAITTSGRLLQLSDGEWAPPALGPTPPVLAVAFGTTELARLATMPKRSQPRRRRPPPRESAEPAGQPTGRPAPDPPGPPVRPRP